VLSKEIESLRNTIDSFGAYCVFISVEEANNEYSFYFESVERVDYRSSRLRLDNLIDQDAVREDVKTPIITFYSYKGGVGRTTILSSYALHCSNLGKRVVVLDCDFEAPGLDNCFIEDQSAIEYSNGLLEFFFDAEHGDVFNLSAYYREVSKNYAGSGEVYVFSAGNLDTSESIGDMFKTNLDHYLNGLSRFNIFSKDYIVDRFNELFARIETELQPDVILIDSRTGYNDLYGIASLRFSNILVGLFGGDVQSRPGLEYFVNMLKRDNTPRLMLLNSIIPPAMKTRLFLKFKEYVNNLLENISGESEKGVYNIDMFPVSYDGILNNIGKPGEETKEYISLIRDGLFLEYEAIFSRLDEYITDTKKPLKRSPTITGAEELKQEKKQLLKNILSNKPVLYGEDVKDFSSELESGRFFFRKSMEDLFNGNKFLVVGNKGTGKTYLYRSLENPEIVDVLKKRANKNSGDYLFIPAVSTISGQSIDTIKFDGAYEKDQAGLFFERFWQIYIWSAVMSVSPFGYKTKLDILDLSDTTESAKTIIEKIHQTDFLVAIENDLDSLSHYLVQSNNKKIVVIFDELDMIVKPFQWSERISPLINLCRKMQFANISTKLFLRSDLYEKTSNITNKNALNNRMIRIEWTREELFAYFFNLVLSHSKSEFEAFVRINKDYSSNEKNNALNAIRNKKLSLDEPVLRVLCAAFFGKFADSGSSHRFGESYDWFYTNLKNANDTISLRPFIDLITLSIDFSIKDDNSVLPILPAAYYTSGKTRAEAVERHFKDLAQEKGNTDLLPIFDFIQNKAPGYLKLDKMTQRELYLLLDAILEDGNLTENSSRDEIIELLTVNGIIKSVFVRLSDGTHKNYHFALLYKYYLGLRSNPKIR
jgi:cellulose biosynthesis protein BcsQ/Cdc6-like AAA superfamily ATPase